MKVEQLIEDLTLEEKVALCSGASTWRTAAIPRLGIPSIKLSDGPNGVRGASFDGAARSTAFPVGSAMAATFDPALIEEVGRAIGEEARDKDVQVVLGPTINLHRHPLGGRHFECYSEDPLLSGRLAVAFVRGVQSRGVGACPKHFVCNDTEFERHTISSEVDERTLRELYLLPFEMAVREAQPWSVMAAYNRINGIYACSHRELLMDVLKKEWGFDGFVVSDWGAALETVENALAGLDLEMPGPTRTRGAALVTAVREGAVPEAAIDESVRRMLRIILRSGKFDDPVEKPERSVNRPAHRELARRVAAKAMVLIKNESVLPLDPRAVRTLAVIGPNAARGQIMGGGSSVVAPHESVMPLAALEETFAQVRHAEGCDIHRYLPWPDPATLFAEASTDDKGGAPGLTLRIFESPAFEGAPRQTRQIAPENPLGFVMLTPPEGGGPIGVAEKPFGATLSGSFEARESGAHSLGLLGTGPCRMFVDGALVIDNWNGWKSSDALFGFGSDEKRATFEAEAGRRYPFRIEFRSRPSPLSALRFGILPPVPDDLMEQAVQIAGSADAVVLVVGSNPDWETEGSDRADLTLPGEQNELIRRVLRVNPNTTVVLNTGAPIAMPWFDDAPAVLQAWLAGQEFGAALRDVLTGVTNPAGRMPTSIPKRIEDTPAWSHYPGEAGVVRYGEGVLMGYRWYDTLDIKPLVCFGHGLSYTRFAYSDLEVKLSEDPKRRVRVSLAVKNTGRRAGAEVVQLYLRDYIRDVAAGAPHPHQELRAFERIEVAPGRTKRVHFELDERAFSYWSTEKRSWTFDPGEFELRIGASSRDIRLRQRITLKDG